jgi:hypothetical protein
MMILKDYYQINEFIEVGRERLDSKLEFFSSHERLISQYPNISRYLRIESLRNAYIVDYEVDNENNLETLYIDLLAEIDNGYGKEFYTLKYKCVASPVETYMFEPQDSKYILNDFAGFIHGGGFDAFHGVLGLKRSIGSESMFAHLKPRTNSFFHGFNDCGDDEEDAYFRSVNKIYGDIDWGMFLDGVGLEGRYGEVVYFIPNDRVDYLEITLAGDEYGSYSNNHYVNQTGIMFPGGADLFLTTDIFISKRAVDDTRSILNEVFGADMFSSGVDWNGDILRGMVERMIPDGCDLHHHADCIERHIRSVFPYLFSSYVEDGYETVGMVYKSDEPFIWLSQVGTNGLRDKVKDSGSLGKKIEEAGVGYSFSDMARLSGYGRIYEMLDLITANGIGVIEVERNKINRLKAENMIKNSYEIFKILEYGNPGNSIVSE